MDYEKMYKEALERARQALDKIQPENQGVIKLIKDAFPELAESEDEKIRKILLKMAKVPRKEIYEHEGITKEQALAYLEKQKVNTEGDFGRGYDCGYQAGYAVAMNEMKPKVATATLDSENQKESLHIPETCKENPVSFTDEGERIRKIITDSVFLAYGANDEYRDVLDYLDRCGIEKQKEPQNKSMAHEDSSWSGILTSPLCKDKNLDDIAQEYVDGVKEYNPTPDWNLIHTAVCYGYHLAEQKEQKPADLPAGFYVTLPDGKKYYTKEMRCNGMNVKVVEPKPAEWSEEDEKQIAQIERIVKNAGCAKMLQEKIHNWFDSLRPSWKPSEEQMEELQSAITFMAIHNMKVDSLVSLHKELKKLM